MPSAVCLHDGEHQITVTFPTEQDRERFKAHYRTLDAMGLRFMEERDEARRANERLVGEVAALLDRLVRAEKRERQLVGLLREAQEHVPYEDDVDETAVWFASTCAYCGSQVAHDTNHPYVSGSNDEDHKPDCWTVRVATALDAPTDDAASTDETETER